MCVAVKPRWIPATVTREIGRGNDDIGVIPESAAVPHKL
jgi:hypothetical protein